MEIRYTTIHTFSCGCQIEKDILSNGQIRLKLNPDINKIPLNCEITWDFIQDGNTKGIFQLESNFAQSYAKKLKPNNIEQLAALSALLRPGCSESIVDGKSVTQHYIDRKNGEEEVTYYHPALEGVLNKTYGLMVYQEDALNVAKKIAGFNLVQADILRRAIGKKKPELMTKVRQEFIQGCIKVGIVNEEEANHIFDWIEKSQRYSFNKCLSPDTVVMTPMGYKLLSELNIGDKILSPKNLENDEYIEVVQIYNNGLQLVYEIELDNGDTIKCTLDHEFLCSDNKKRPLYEILSGDYEIMVYNNVYETN